MFFHAALVPDSAQRGPWGDWVVDLPSQQRAAFSAALEGGLPVIGETSACSSASVGSAPEDGCSVAWDGVFTMPAVGGCDKQMRSDIQPGWSSLSLEAWARGLKGCPDPLAQTDMLKDFLTVRVRRLNSTHASAVHARTRANAAPLGATK